MFESFALRRRETMIGAAMVTTIKTLFSGNIFIMKICSYAQVSANLLF